MWLCLRKPIVIISAPPITRPVSTVSYTHLREEFLKAAARGEKPAGYYLTAYRIQTENGFLKSYRQIEGSLPEYDSREEEYREGKLWLAYVELMQESPCLLYTSRCV